ncbi:MAG: hypothetical protein E1N59_1751 [Puniceicoccaceae bacterium 5H]|nr:MAG: hypothetical protein E1N59_1751 [Puniceicoccaceae bacterium 5H]
MTDPRHRPFTISLPPALKERAEARARALGLSFSRYVNRCLEAELQGHAQILRDEEDAFDLARAVERAREFMLRKRDSIDFEDDVARILETLPVSVERFARVEDLRVDFLCTAGDRRIAVECRANVRRNYALTLGQSLLLSATAELDAIVLVVPYLDGLDPRLVHELEPRGIVLTTPDRLAESLAPWLTTE